MASILQKLQIVEAVVNGATFRETGKIIGLSGARTAKNFYAMCEELGISTDIETLRSDPEAVISAVRAKRKVPSVTLPDWVVTKLLAPSGYRLGELTLEKFVETPGSEVLHKFGPDVLLEVHQWLASYGLTLKASEAEKPHDFAAIAQALLVLRVYGIPTAELTRTDLALWKGLPSKHGVD